MLDLSPGHHERRAAPPRLPQGIRHQDGDPQIVGSVDTLGETGRAEDGHAQLLAKDPGINVVYTVNEPAAFGAAQALKAAGRSDDDVILVSVDGGCDAVKNGVRPGVIDATSSSTRRTWPGWEWTPLPRRRAVVPSPPATRTPASS